MKLQTTIRNLLLATFWIAVGFFCLLQMKTTDVVQTITFDSLPNTDDAAIRAYQQVSTEPVVVTRRGRQLTIKYARPTRSPINADIDWQSLGYSRWTSNYSHHEVRTNWMLWYIVAGFAFGLLVSARRRWPRRGLCRLQPADNNAIDTEPPTARFEVDDRARRPGHR